MNVTVGDPAGRSNRFLVQFFSRLNLILNAYMLMYTHLLINKNNYEFHFVMFHMQVVRINEAVVTVIFGTKRRSIKN